MLRFIEDLQLISPSQSVLVALSGGIDSVSLLNVLLQIHKKLKFRVFAAHLNHMLRHSATRDENFVKDLCRDLNIELYVERVNVIDFCRENGLGIEEGARKLRYEFLERAKNALHCDVIALAHNLNDLVETIIHRMARGTGPTGLVCMKPKTDDRIRPFLYIKRSEIESYAKRRNLNYVEDETNLDIKYTRNYIRHQVIPMLRKINPSIEEALFQLHLSCLMLEEHVERFIERQRTIESDRRIIFSIRELDMFQIIELIKRATEKFGERLEFEHVRQFLQHLHDSSWTLRLSKKLWLEKSFELVCVEKEHTKIESMDITHPGLYDFNGWLFKVSEDVESELFAFVKLPIFLRTRKQGDRIESKKLKDLLIEARIPSFLRNEMPLVFEDDIILWVPYVYVDERLKNRIKNDNFAVLNLLNDPMRFILELRKEAG